MPWFGRGQSSSDVMQEEEGKHKGRRLYVVSGCMC